MTTFVNRLANMALGQRAPGAAQVVLPPRFAPAPAISSVAPAPWSAADQPVDAAETTPPARHFPLPVRDALRYEAPPVPPSPTRVTPPAVARRVIPAARDMAQLPRIAAMPESSKVRAARHDGVVLPPPTVRIGTPKERDDAATRPAPLSPPLASPPRRDAAPLSESALAARIIPSADAAPVVHVTIDRIDVRAPDASKPAAPSKPPRRPPAISLGDYLHNSRSGGRP